MALTDHQAHVVCPVTLALRERGAKSGLLGLWGLKDRLVILGVRVLWGPQERQAFQAHLAYQARRVVQVPWAMRV
jgi:hypothetical protein